jgi:hypothetical protein
MRFEIKNPGGSILTLVRQAGYHALRDSFVRPLGRSGYPRFHLYIEQKGNDLVFNLHLDQKKPVYKGTAAHSGEYDSAVVRQEAERIKQTIL